MTLTQLQALKAAIAANSTTIPAGQDWTGSYAGQAINALPVGNGAAAAAIAGWYSLLASPTYLAWKTNADIATLRAALTLSNYTPADAVPLGSAGDLTLPMQFGNRAFICQLKQANALFLLQQNGSYDCSSTTLRQAFQDCMTGIPAGNSGANVNAGWGTPAAPGAVRLLMQRAISNIEKLYSAVDTGTAQQGHQAGDARGSTTNPDLLVFEGGITFQDVLNAWAS